MNKLYFVGVGPGDPELITLKARNIIRESNVIFYIDNRSSNLAFSTIKDLVNDDQVTVPLQLPMSADKALKEENYKAIKETIRKYLKSNDCSFITLGDPAIYSTVFYFLEEFKDQVEIIPGISSFSALSADLKIPLVLGQENLAVINLSAPEDIIINELNNNETVVILRIVKKRIDFLKKLLISLSLENNVIIYSNIGLKNANISRDIDDLNENLPYMTTILIKKNL